MVTIEIGKCYKLGNEMFIVKHIYKTSDTLYLTCAPVISVDFLEIAVRKSVIRHIPSITLSTIEEFPRNKFDKLLKVYNIFEKSVETILESPN